MRDPNEILELFKETEIKAHVDGLIYKDNNVWPVFRLKWGFDTLYSKNVPKFRKFPKESNLKRFFQIPYLILKIGILYTRFLFSLSKIKSSNWFLITDDLLFVDKINGKKYCRYVDPYYDFFQQNGIESGRVTFKSLELQPCNGSAYLNNAITIQIDQLQKIYYCLQKLRTYTGAYIKDVYAAKAVILKVCRSVKKEEQKYLTLSYYNVFEDVNQYDFCFSTLFKFYKPKNILFESYYSEMKMGMIAAARRRGINTVEIQHGVVEDFMYIPYNYVIEKQNMLPDYLWCWSNNDVKTVNQYNKAATRIKPIKLGNLWYKKLFKDSAIIPPDYMNLKKDGIKVVLITLQHQIGYQKIFKEIINKVSSNWPILVRFHPLMTEKDKQEYKEALNNYSNVDFKCNELLNLFQCYRLADINLTHSSTTAFEALNFNLRSILVDEIGYAYYKKAVENGVLFFCNNADEVVKQITNIRESSIAESYLDYRIDISDKDLIEKLKGVLIN